MEARPENLERIRGFIESACAAARLPRAEARDWKLAVDEACANVVDHGYAGRPPGPVAVSFEADSARISVTITDRGRRFDPADAPDADILSDWKARRVGGLGWHLIRRLVGEIRYESDPERGNRLTLMKSRKRGRRAMRRED